MLLLRQMLARLEESADLIARRVDHDQVLVSGVDNPSLPAVAHIRECYLVTEVQAGPWRSCISGARPAAGLRE